MRWRTDSPESEVKSMTTTNPPATLAGSYRVGDLDLKRICYGAMQLAGPGVFGPPRDRVAAIEVLRTAVELGVNHIDTADAYGPYITNEIIREALFPYSDNLHIVTKIGVVRDERGGWLPANSPESLREQVHDNLLPARARRTRRGQPPDPRRDRRARDGFGHARGAVRGAGRTTAAGPDPAPGPEHGQPRPAGARRSRSRRWYAGRTSTTSPTGRTRRCWRPPPSSTSPTCRTSRSAASRRCSRTCWSWSPSGSTQRRWRSPSPGSCSTRRT
jgi:Aldo/keto reductase family